MDQPMQDDLKWFGDGFDGFPKRLPEDVVEYIVLILDTKLNDIQTRERLQAFQRALVALEKKFLKEYIWQRDPIKLDLVRDEGRWMLKGSTNYGDSVADEWLIVWLLRELSKEFPDAWVRIYDTDGEFLLIEAANALPNWLNPEVAENRVWVNAHQLRVIPLPKNSEPRSLKLEEALSIIKDTPANPQRYPKIEDEAFHRLKSYPAAIGENQHHATLPLPRKVAHILHSNPSYIAPVVEAFYLRDPISLRLIQPEKSKTPLNFPPDDFVDVSVRFTKVLYAQLLGQKWAPPSPWSEALSKLVAKNGTKTAASQEKAEIGLKVAAGMEMLTQHKGYADKPATREIKLLLSDLDAGDDVLPTDEEIAAWPQREDSEAWLNIDYADFERELAGKGDLDPTPGFGDKSAQTNLRKMVERFNAFLEDDDAGVEGAKGLGLDPMDVDDSSDRGWSDPESSESEGGASDEDAYADAEFEDYEKAMQNFMALSSAEKSALLDDARALANAEEADREEDEEIQKLSEAMGAELSALGALKLDPGNGKGKKPGKKAIKSGDKGKGKAKIEELAKDDEGANDDEELLDEDYNLADNMLKAFKGQAGMAGPAGNLMGLMGVHFPPDADDEEKPQLKAARKTG